jgi:hypothetical protein
MTQLARGLQEFKEQEFQAQIKTVFGALTSLCPSIQLVKIKALL